MRVRTLSTGVRRRAALAALGVAALFGSSMAAAASAPGGPPALPTVKAPKLRSGVPDFQGAWNRYPDLLISPFLPDQPKADDPLATPRQTPRPKLKPKYQAIFEQRQQAMRESVARNQPIAERSVNCIPDGMPNMMRGAWIMEILQTPEQINISQELYNQTRRIYMNQKLPPLDELDPGFYGRSVGHYEGQVLVIETIGTRDDILPSAGGSGGSGGGDTPRSPQLKFVERIRYVSPDIIQDEITMLDPEVFETPWVWHINYKRMPTDYKMQEYICEANRTYIDENGIQRRLDADTAQK